MSTQAKSALIAREDRTEYHAHLEQYFSEQEPANPHEKFLVRQMADAMWRIRRIELLIFDSSLGGNRRADPKLNRYEKAIEGIYFRAARELRILRKREEKEIREIQRKQAAEFSSMIESYVVAPKPSVTKSGA